MKTLGRYNLIHRIAILLQKQMKTTEINILLGGYGVEHDGVSIVGSKRLYVEFLLAKVDDQTILDIAREIEIKVPPRTAQSSDDLMTLLSARGLSRCVSDFDRSLRSIDGDTDAAISGASSTLESICKAILDAIGETYPSDESKHWITGESGLSASQSVPWRSRGR